MTHPLLCLFSAGQSEAVNRDSSARRAAAQQDSVLWYALHPLSGLQRVCSTFTAADVETVLLAFLD